MSRGRVLIPKARVSRGRVLIPKARVVRRELDVLPAVLDGRRMGRFPTYARQVGEVPAVRWAAGCVCPRRPQDGQPWHVQQGRAVCRRRCGHGLDVHVGQQALMLQLELVQAVGRALELLLRLSVNAAASSLPTTRASSRAGRRRRSRARRGMRNILPVVVHDVLDDEIQGAARGGASSNSPTASRGLPDFDVEALVLQDHVHMVVIQGLSGRGVSSCCSPPDIRRVGVRGNRRPPAGDRV